MTGVHKDFFLLMITNVNKQLATPSFDTLSTL
jgi:hypothetical protein